jgi:uncharacterized protein YodC (DUF2158 family)
MYRVKVFSGGPKYSVSGKNLNAMIENMLVEIEGSTPSQ